MTKKTTRTTLRNDQAGGVTHAIESDEVRAMRIERERLANQHPRDLAIPIALTVRVRSDGASPEQIAMDRERVRLSRQILVPAESTLDSATRDRIANAAKHVTTNLIAPLAPDDRRAMELEIQRIDRRDSAEDLERKDSGWIASIYLSALTREARLRAL